MDCVEVMALGQRAADAGFEWAPGALNDSGFRLLGPCVDDPRRVMVWDGAAAVPWLASMLGVPDLGDDATRGILAGQVAALWGACSVSLAVSSPAAEDLPPADGRVTWRVSSGDGVRLGAFQVRGLGMIVAMVEALCVAPRDGGVE